MIYNDEIVCYMYEIVLDYGYGWIKVMIIYLICRINFEGNFLII